MLLLLDFTFFINFNLVFNISKFICQCEIVPLLSPVINSFSLILITQVMKESNKNWASKLGKIN